MDTNYLAAHILCTADEKQACMDTVDKLMTMAGTARCCGLVELEQLVRHERYSRPALIRVGVSLIADGVDPDTVQQILENYILAAGMSNQEFLEKDFSELECALAGSNPDVIRIFLKNMGEGRRLSFFEFVACIKKLELSAVENCQQEIKSVISRLARQGEICLGKPAAITQRKEQDADK